jgi:hypothetical protein
MIAKGHSTQRVQDGEAAVLISNWKTRSVLCLELKGATLKRGIGLSGGPEFCARQLVRSTHCDEERDVVAIILRRYGCG